MTCLSSTSLAKTRWLTHRIVCCRIQPYRTRHRVRTWHHPSLRSWGIHQLVWALNGCMKTCLCPHTSVTKIPHRKIQACVREPLPLVYALMHAPLQTQLHSQMLRPSQAHVCQHLRTSLLQDMLRSELRLLVIRRCISPTRQVSRMLRGLRTCPRRVVCMW